ncbi:MAG: helix-turn-helix domain-containing protein [Burkholderiales bacterium]
MAQTPALVEAIKRELRARQLTYAQVAKHLGYSEAGVKRMFSRGEFTLGRIDRICEFLGLEFSDIARQLGGPEAVVSRLTEEQEEQLVADPKLMLVALCTLSQMPFDKIVGTYEISEAECVKLLARLDRLKFIQLLPNNRIRLLASRAFAWIPDGPIQRLFKSQLSQDFLRSGFGGAHDMLVLVNGTLSQASIASVMTRMKRIASEFAEMRIDDARLPHAERIPITLLVAARPWEPEYLGRYRRRRATASAKS